MKQRNKTGSQKNMVKRVNWICAVQLISGLLVQQHYWYRADTLQGILYATKEIHIRGVRTWPNLVPTSCWRIYSYSWRAFWAFVTCITSKCSLIWAFRIWEILEHTNFQSLYLLLKSISGSMFMDLFNSYWRPEGPYNLWHNLETFRTKRQIIRPLIKWLSSSICEWQPTLHSRTVQLIR